MVPIESPWALSYMTSVESNTVSLTFGHKLIALVNKELQITCVTNQTKTLLRVLQCNTCSLDLVIMHVLKGRVGIGYI